MKKKVKKEGKTKGRKGKRKEAAFFEEEMHRLLS